MVSGNHQIEVAPEEPVEDWLLFHHLDCSSIVVYHAARWSIWNIPVGDSGGHASGFRH